MQKLKCFILAILTAVSLLMFNTQSSFAFTFVVDEQTNLLTGINGLIVGDDVYNATFVEGRAYEVFWTGTDWVFDFNDSDTAKLAAGALMAAIESVEEYDYNPSGTIYGLGGSGNGTYMLTPYKITRISTGYRDIRYITFENQHNISCWEEYDTVSEWRNPGMEGDSHEMDMGYFPGHLYAGKNRLHPYLYPVRCGFWVQVFLL